LDDLQNFALAPFVGMPVGKDVLVIIVAIVAPATRIERDVRVGSVHDAAGTNGVASTRRFQCIHGRNTLNGSRLHSAAAANRLQTVFERYQPERSLPARVHARSRPS